MSAAKRSAADLASSSKNKKVKSEVDDVKVEIRVYPERSEDDEDFSDYDDEEDRENEEYVGINDENKAENVSFKSLGRFTDYDCTRNGYARVLLNDVKIGTISFIIIDRSYLGGNGLSFWEACDAESGEMEQIAAKFFKADGSLKTSLSRYLRDPSPMSMAQGGAFVYITAIRLQAPYDRTATDENAKIGAQALTTLVNGVIWGNDDINATLAM